MTPPPSSVRRWRELLLRWRVLVLVAGYALLHGQLRVLRWPECEHPDPDHRWDRTHSGHRSSHRFHKAQGHLPSSISGTLEPYNQILDAVILTQNVIFVNKKFVKKHSI